jgi:hypothetical protein
MASFIWQRDPHEAFRNPYEYGAQEQFLSEANALLTAFHGLLSDRWKLFSRDEQTLEKATWMLSIDLVDALSECASLLDEKRHRPAARMFRDAVETMDVLRVLHGGTELAASALFKWYSNETIPHRECRNYLRQIYGEQVAEQRRKYYVQLSKFTHRTYRTLLDSYSIGGDNNLIHDSLRQSRLLVLPQTIAVYLAVLADLIVQASKCLVDTAAIQADDAAAARTASLDSHTVDRRFEPQ